MMNLGELLIRQNFASRQGELLVGGIRVSSLLEMYGTPAFLYDQAIVDSSLTRLRAALPKGFSIFYSVKANPAESVLRHVLSRGCGLEIASAGELLRALDAGCEPGRIIFAGPGKTESELELAISREIGEIHFESLLEARRISCISQRLGLHTNLSVRINPKADAIGGAMRMGGRPAPFGIDEEALDEILPQVLALPNIHVHGIHLFTGTQILDARTLVDQYCHGLQIAKSLTRRVGRPLRVVDFGGGLGIPYFQNEKPIELDQLRSGLAELFEPYSSDPDFSGTSFVVEPGRFLIGEAGIYIARVNDIKVSRGKKFLILDGGMNHHLAASGNLGQTIKRNYPIALVNRLDGKPEETVDVVGPLCTPLDTLARGISLPRAAVGDLLAIFQSGAYGLSASPLHFLSHREPAEIWVANGEHRPMRRGNPLADRYLHASNA